MARDHRKTQIGISTVQRLTARTDGATRTDIATPNTTAALNTRPHRTVRSALRIAAVLEGGFSPDEITPRPPLVSDRLGRLSFDVSSANSVEQTVLGGLKSKNIDVVVSKTGVGPVLAISVKGTLNAFRNLTNRMEEAIGNATNIHLMYPGLVYGFFHVLKATRADTPGVVPNDIAITLDGNAVPGIKRYAEVLTALHGRRLVRDELADTGRSHSRGSIRPPVFLVICCDHFRRRKARYVLIASSRRC